MTEKQLPRRRYIFSLIIYASILLVLWTVYHTIIHQAINKSETENSILMADSLTGQISAEFRQMNTVATVIAGSDYVQDFIGERSTAAYYEKAATVSEIVRKAAFPISAADSVITISDNGRFYRFSGGLSNRSLETLYEAFKGAGNVYTVIELDDIFYFCHSVPVIDYGGQLPVRLGNVIMLTGLEKTRRTLDFGDNADSVVLFNDVAILSNNKTLEGLTIVDIKPMYGVVSAASLTGTALSVAVAIPVEALFPESELFYAIAFISLCLLLLMIFILYRYQSSHIIIPSEKTKQNMSISLLASQMDAHFVVNTLKSIKRLSDKGQTDKTGQMAEGLAAILQHQHAGDKLVNIFDDFQILQKYIDIMNIKFGGKFNVEYHVDDSLEACRMPGLILQPIVENALTHGLGNKDGDTRLIINGFIWDGCIVFEISDNGTGILPAKLKDIQDSLIQSKNALDDFPKPGLHGVALTNIQQRIRIKCGDGFGITVESEFGKGTTVTVALPKISDRE